MTSQNVALWDINKALWVIFLFIVTKVFHLWKMTYLSFNWHNSGTSLIFYAVFGKMVLFGNTIYNGFKFSKSKTQCVHFCQLMILNYIYMDLSFQLLMKRNFLWFFFFFFFDRKLSFIPHIKYLKAKCLKALNLLEVLSHTSWGADRTILLHLYRFLIRSK